MSLIRSEKPRPPKMIQSPVRVLSERSERTGTRTVLVAEGELISEDYARELGIDVESARKAEDVPAPILDDPDAPVDQDATVDFDGCTTCGATGDDPCVTPSGKPTKNPHRARAEQRAKAGAPAEDRQRRGPAEDRDGDHSDAKDRILDVDPDAGLPPEVTDTPGQDADA